MGVLRIMSNTDEADERGYIEKALKMLMVTAYKSGTMDDGKFDCYVCLYDKDIDWLSRSINHIYDTYEFPYYDHPKYQVNPDFITDMNFYGNDEAFKNPVLASYDAISILSDYGDYKPISDINCIFTPSDIVYSFNYHSLMDDILMLLETIGDDDNIHNVLIVGRDNNLYAKILSAYISLRRGDLSQINISNCDINEYGRYSNMEYDCILIIPYMESVITNILHIKSSNYIVYGIYNNYRQSIYYNSQVGEFNSFYKRNNLNYKMINSISWHGFIYGNIDSSRFNKIHGSKLSVGGTK